MVFYSVDDLGGSNFIPHIIDSAINLVQAETQFAPTAGILKNLCLFNLFNRAKYSKCVRSM